MKRILVLCLMVFAASALAYELALTPQEEVTCEEGGGCVVLSRVFVKQLVQRAYETGRQACEQRL